MATEPRVKYAVLCTGPQTPCAARSAAGEGAGLEEGAGDLVVGAHQAAAADEQLQRARQVQAALVVPDLHGMWRLWWLACGRGLTDAWAVVQVVHNLWKGCMQSKKCVKYVPFVSCRATLGRTAPLEPPPST